MEEYRLNPLLPVIKSGFKGNVWKNDRFRSLHPYKHPGLMDVFRWKRSKGERAAEKNNDTFKLSFRQNQDFIDSEEDQIMWLGHACFFIRLQGINFLTDPCLSDFPFLKRKVASPIPVEKIRNIDFVLLSHAHRDHFDNRSLKIIARHNPKVKFLVPLETGALLRSIGIKNYQEAAWYQTFNLVTNPQVAFLPTQHWNRRGLFDHNKTLWGSFLLKNTNSGKSVYFAGDSAYGNHYKEIEELFGNPDYCLMPIGAYLPRSIMKGSHMDPTEAYHAYKDMGGKNFIPMHYGTYDLSDEPPGEPISITRSLFRDNQTNDQLRELAVGEQLFIQLLP